MILFLFAESLNYSMTPRVIHDEIIKRKNDQLKVIDVGKYDLINIKKYITNAELVVFDNSIILAMNSGQLLSRNFFLLNRQEREFYFDIWSAVFHSDKPIFLFSPMSDLHVVNFGLERSLYLNMIERISGIFWQFYRCPLETDPSLDRYPYKTLEPFGVSKTDVTNVWDEITKKIEINIDFPNSVSLQEMMKTNPKKKWDFIVPGAGYLTRKIALDSAKDDELSIAPYQQYYRWLINIPYYFYSKIKTTSSSIKQYQISSLKLYKHLISKSSVAFVCGSELKYNVRKYWEIPSWRTAMIAYPTNSLLHYGFDDGVHYLQTFPEEVGEKTRYLLKSKNIADKLVQNAWNLVAENHSSTIRVEQVLDCLRAYQKGKLSGACYNNGKFEIF